MRIHFHLVTQLILQFIKIHFIGSVKCFGDIGKINNVPKIIKPWLCKADAACQMLIFGGMMLGQMEMPKPLKPKKMRPKVSRNGATCLFCAIALCMPHAAANTNTGTGKKNHRFGKSNQRAAIWASSMPCCPRRGWSRRAIW